MKVHKMLQFSPWLCSARCSLFGHYSASPSKAPSPDHNAGSMAAAAGEKLVRVDFEVFGRVQGVFFRKYTEKRAKELELRGWVRNTMRQTVEGQIEGGEKQVELMKEWLQKTGSPSSIIEKAIFKNQADVDTNSFRNFEMRSTK